jgi:hypothetical protein
MDRSKLKDDDARHFRTEAATLLGINEGNQGTNQ